MGRKQKYDALMEFIARVQGATGLPSPHIERVINSGIDITKATPADVYKLATGMDLPGPAQAYVPPAKQNVSMAIEGPSLEQRVANDPEIQSAIKMAGPAIARMNPELAQRVAAGDTEAMLEVYRMVVKNEGQMPVRQMELPLGDEAPSTGMIPFGVRGAGVPAGGLTGPGPSRGVFNPAELSTDVNLPRIGTSYAPVYNPGTDMITAPLRGLPGDVNPSFDLSTDLLLRRLGTSAGVPVGPSRPFTSSVRTIDALPGPSQSRGGWGAMAATAAAAAGAGLAASRLMPKSAPLTDAASPESAPLQEPDLTMADDTPVELNNDGLAELAAESSPPPVVSSPVPMKGLQRRPGPDTGFIETSSQYALKPAQQRTLEVMLDAGIDPDRAQSIVRGQRSLTTAEERAIISNGPARARRIEDEMMTRRNARMGAY